MAMVWIAASLLGGGPLTEAAEQPVTLERFVLRDPEGQRIVLPPSDLTVICFLGTECPLARLYGPRLAAMAGDMSASGVVFLAINSNPQDSPAEIGEYARKHGIHFPIAKDADQVLADAFAATRTPEVFVLDRSGRIQYRGRIDDQYQPGKARPEPTQHDLRDAIQHLLAGRSVPQPRTEAVGCVITRVGRKAAVPQGKQITFSRDVLPILHRRCVECHRSGNIGPFALTDYDEVVGWGQMILEVIDQGRMPPWHADPRFGEFVGARQMPVAERDTLAAWVEQGMPAGDPTLLPESPEWTDGWHLPTPPDTQLEMRERPYRVPAEGTLEYQYFVVDPGWETDRWVAAAQVIPGDPAVVHHAIVFVRPPDGSRFRGIGWLGGYVPGQRAAPLPPGHARHVPAGSKLVFQMHYTPNGHGTEDHSTLGIWFADAETVTHEVTTQVAIDQSFEIPPGAADYAVSMQLDSFPRESRLLSAMPHMHLRGKSFQLDVRSDGKAKTVLSVPQYDFNWQHRYRFAKPLALDEVESLEMTVRFDNSSRNPVNPNPREYVSWGDQTWEEMAIAFFDITCPREPAPAEHSVPKGADVESSDRGGRITSKSQTSAATRRATDEFFSQMDSNGDGLVRSEEAPLAFRAFAFRRFDLNEDGVLDRDEIQAAAAERL